MPFVDANGVRTRYEESAPHPVPYLLFCNSLGTTLDMWALQLSGLSHSFRVLRYDIRGQGRSDVPPGPYSISQLADDLIALLNQLGIHRVHFCGLSMGGMIGMSLALRYPDRLSKLILCNTAPKIGTAETWNARIDAVQKGGMAAIVEGVLERWFTRGFREKDPVAIELTRRMLLNSSVEGYTACCAAVRDMDVREEIGRIRLPVLVISGTHDPVTTPRDGQLLRDTIPGAEYKELPAAHLSNVEAEEAFTMEVSRFLKA
jgi:3-oxoadipate enol-lactonase